MTELENKLFKIIGVIENSNLPIIFKGALTLKAARPVSEIDRITTDIDCDWIGSPPNLFQIEEKLNDAMAKYYPSISFKATRSYVIGKRSAGFNIFENNILLSKIDLSIASKSPSNRYHYGEINFTGYALDNIIADKVSVLSSAKIFRRTKDFVDIYSTIVVTDLAKENILNVLSIKKRELNDFTELLNRKDELEHSYNRMKGIINKPDFQTIYDVVVDFANGFINEEKNLIWEHNSLKWILDNTKGEKMENIKIRIIMEDGKQLEAELYPEIAPITVENFVNLINQHFYDGLIFHRVIKGFMIQGGDPTGTGMGGSDNKIKGEFLANGVINELKHERGVLSMARSMDPDSASSQFFIMHQDAPHLDGQYAAFGEVISGMDVVDEIANTQTDYRDKPLTDQRIKTIEII